MNRIDVLLIDGNSDHYLIPVSMLQDCIEVGGETYVRTEEMRRVQARDRSITTHRVYRMLAYPEPKRLYESNLV